MVADWFSSICNFDMKNIIHLSQVFFLLIISQNSFAFDWTSNNVQLMYGSDFEFGDRDRTTLTVEHANGWAYGQNFFFVDVIDRSDIGIEVYAEVYSFLSFNKITGMGFSLGPIKDISLFAGLNISNKSENDNFKAYVAGISLDLHNQFFDYLQLDIAAYKADDVTHKYGLQFTPVWSYPFQIGPAKFKFRGFTDFRTANTNNSGNFNILAQPQVLLDIGDLTGIKTDTLYIGTEYSYWYNKFGVKGIEESVVQAMLIGFF